MASIEAMARIKIEKVLDDFDPNKEADESRVIGWEGYDYVIDLTTRNYKQLLKDLTPYLEAAHMKVKQPRGRTRTNIEVAPRNAGKQERTAIREWARENGYEVATRGNIAKEIVDAYNAANGK
ncbi:nucloid associated Lsr2-like [Mycobacterium phage Anthony]|uniref:Lsr2-like DNA bridging protein n=1 Tax=Mycobacterium phage Anthony TaxID=2599857 RepID=A0A5J6THE2_9CAUD|nr:nucloid associated Lsr2-like [Mycobacterium phage Anthony]QFG10403.1 Lsr2-like DNA bridging protein [Mycobacterium phage Anthony]